MPRSTRQAKQPVRSGWHVWAGSGRVVGQCAMVLAVAVLATHATKYPRFAGFWAGVDQQRYLEAARALASFDLSPARQHYPPLFPLMAAPFVWLTPWQPFMVPDLACLLVSLFLFVRIAARLVPRWPGGVAAVCFVAATMGSKMMLGLWIVPWSSSGAAPFQFGALLLALRFGERPSASRAAALGLCVAAIAGFRPSDAAVLVATCAPYAAWAMLRPGASGHRRATTILAGAGGAACGLAAIAWLHWLVFGLSAGPYIAESAGIGFEWRLLPLRWVMLVVGPQPLLPEGTGMVAHLPWLIPGIAGLVLAIVSAPGPARAPAFLACATVAAHWALYLAYRDMHAYGLWRFYNIHYFKWTFPFLVLWAAQILYALTRPRSRVQALAALVATLLLFTWRPILRKPIDIVSGIEGQRIILPRAPRMGEALLLPVFAQPSLPASQAWSTLYFARTTLNVGGQSFVTKRDTKLLPVPGGALLITLRPMPPGPATLDLPPGIGLERGQPVRLFHQATVFGLPCPTGC